MNTAKAIKREGRNFGIGIITPVAIFLEAKKQYFNETGGRAKKTPILNKCKKLISSAAYISSKDNKNKLPLSTYLGIGTGIYLPIAGIMILLLNLKIDVIDDTPQPCIATDTQGQEYTITPTEQSNSTAQSKFILITREQAIEHGLLEAKNPGSLNQQ